MTPQEKLLKLLHMIVESVSRVPPKGDLPHFEETPSEFLMRFRVHAADQGRFVGKLGQTIWAIQTIFWYAGFTQVMHAYTVELLEPEGKDRQSAPFRFNPKWDRAKIFNLLYNIRDVCLPLHAQCQLREINPTTAVAELKIEAYLKTPMSDPCFVDAFSIVMKAAGMSQGVNLTTEATFV